MKKTFAAALCALLLSAQAPNDPSRITVEVFRANFLMTVTDKKGGRGRSPRQPMERGEDLDRPACAEASDDTDGEGVLRFGGAEARAAVEEALVGPVAPELRTNEPARSDFVVSR